MAAPSVQWFDPRSSGARQTPQAEAADLASRMPRLIAKAKHVAASVAHGVHGRKRAGAGETFWQYRPFEVGELAHRIDWRRSARSDQLYVREREWEAAHSFYIWMDGSPSMAFKSALAPVFKLDRAALLGLAVADALVRGGERVGALGLTPAVSARNIIDRLARALCDSADILAGWEVAPSVDAPMRGKLVLISDFLCEPSALAAQLADYANRGASGVLVMVLDPAEESLPFEGETRFVDTDGGAPYHAGAAQTLRNAYRVRLAEHRAAIEDAAKHAGFLFLLHHTDRPAAEAALALTMALTNVVERR